MAMKNLVDGECGGANPLVRAADHFTQRDHRELLHHPHQLHPNVSAAAAARLHGDQVFRMDALLSDIERANTAHSSISAMQPPKSAIQPYFPPDQWVSEFTASSSSANRVAGSSSNSITGSMQPQMRSQSFVPMSQPFFSRPPMHMVQPYRSMTHESQAMSPPQVSSASDLLLPQPFLQQQEERLSQESQEGTKSAPSLAEEARRLYHSVQDDEQLKSSEFLSFVEELGFGKERASESQQQQEDKHQEQGQVHEEKDDLAFWHQLASEWDQAAKEDADAYSWLGDYGSVTDPFRDGYFFKDDNPLKEVPNAFEEGMRKLQQGDIPSAVLLFEAACQQEPEHALAWQFLGTTQAKNEQDPAAIRALKRSLELEPNNLTSLMSLAVSYTNESYQKHACDCLSQWIKSNPAYAECSNFFPSTSTSAADSKNDHPMIVSSVISSAAFQQTKEAFIHAARKLPQNLDPDVQCGLGVLFNLSGDYDKAVDCFKAALAAKPDDALLWNRLGATLANGNRSEEAIDAYRRALEISPGYIRCRFNLGVSCINLNSHREAAEHFLTVLNFQNAGRGPSQSTSRTAMSSNVWTALRMVLSLLNRQDLYEAVEFKDLNRLNSEFNTGN